MAELKCRYITENSPFLKIAPLKLEEASLKPYIVVYHDVMYDKEIEFIEQTAKPRVSHSFKCHTVEGNSIEDVFSRLSSYEQPSANGKSPRSVLAN